MPILRSAAQVPPKGTAAGKLTVGQAKLRENEEAVNGIFGLGAFALMLVKQPADAMAISIHGPGISHEIAVLAETNETFANLIKYITNVGPYAALVTAVMPLAMQLAVNHEKVSADSIPMDGIVSKQTLLDRAQAQMDQAAQEMQRAA
jgi:hypothetical protein